jgi:hypothetical protein
MRTILIVVLWLGYYGLGDRVPPLNSWAHLGMFVVALSCLYQDGEYFEARIEQMRRNKREGDRDG